MFQDSTVFGRSVRAKSAPSEAALAVRISGRLEETGGANSMVLMERSHLVVEELVG